MYRLLHMVDPNDCGRVCKDSGMTQNQNVSDESRILSFEWHATHYESLSKNLPPLPRQISTSFPGLGPIGFSEADWHAVTIRAMALRKFYLEDCNAVRIDEVLRALSRQATPGSDTQTVAAELVSRDAKSSRPSGAR